MKSKDKLDMYIERRLEEWAEWYSSDTNGLGYAKRNIIARLKDDGGLVSRSTGSKSFMVNEEAEEIEKLYLYMYKQNEKRAEALRIHYHYPYEHESKAIQHGYSKTQYYHYLNIALAWLKGYFIARKKILI